MANNKLQAIVSSMAQGDKKTILYGLRHSGALIRINGIVFACVHKYADTNIVAQLIRLTKDNDTVMGYSVSQFAIAALDVLDIEKYDGKDEQIIDLINSNFVF